MLSFAVCLSLVSIVYSAGKTSVSIDGTNFKINGEITYSKAKNSNVHGLLINSRMINAIFDNSKQEYNYLFTYPDTKKWDPQRNTKEYVGNLTKYKNYGMLAFTVGLQGGNPFGYGFNEPKNISGQPWINSAYDEKNGNLISAYFDRLTQVLNEADDIGMIPIVQLFYAAQVNRMNDNSQMNALNKTLDWLENAGYTNILIEVANECNGCNGYASESEMPETIKYIRKYTKGKYILGSSLGGGHTPSPDLIDAVDMIMLHGNGQSPSGITKMINTVKGTSAYKNKPKPIIFNEDDHYDFDKSSNNFKSAVDGHASWGIFVDCNQTTAGDYIYGYQCVPAAWDVNTPIKKSFFNAVQGYVAT
eukprot:3875_1